MRSAKVHLGGAVAVLLASSLVSFAAPSEDYRVVQGAEQSAPMRARSVDVDLRDLPVAPDWQPGDAVREIPRRLTSKPALRPQAAPVDVDPLLSAQEKVQPNDTRAFSTPALNFAGQGFSGVNPPDTSGDVGPNHFIQMINHSNGASFVVYSKTGSVLSGPTYLDSLGTGNCADGLGDPIVLYDHLANRWLLSEFSNSGNQMCVYVSKTADPVSGGWWAYAFTASAFPDYPHYGVWPDAYYVGTNESSPTVYAFDRAKMLSGQSATMQKFTASKLAGFGFQILMPADLDGSTAPPSGAPMVFARHRDDEVHNSGSANSSQDYVDLYEFKVNWTTPSSSTFSGPTSVAVAEFDSSLCGLTSFNCVPQPGSSTTLDPIREVMMYRLAYRNLGTYQALVGNFSVDVNGADRAGVRWFELRKTTGSWSLYQQGTYSPDTTNRWLGASAMDKQGNIALAYNVSASSSVYPGARYAGRLATDSLGVLTQGESTIVSGSAANGSNRWGDYAEMGVDPADDCTFWFTTQYNTSSNWSTRIASFKFDACSGGTPTPDFSLSTSPSSVSVNPGASVTSTVTVTSLNGFNAAVALSASGLPSGVTASFSPTSVTPASGGSATSTLTLTASTSAAAGTTGVTVSGVNGTTTRTGSVSLTVNAVGGAVYDSTLKAPKCATVGKVCDSGASLLLGRSSKGPEPNYPNTINASCADGTSGTYHSDESNDALKVETVDGTNFAAGKQVKVTATVYAYSTSSDYLDLYYTATASSPSWTLVGTYKPSATGITTITANYTLPTGTLQAVRANFRYNGSAGSCTTGSYDDHDDLIFAVGAGSGDTTAPTTSITAPSAGSTVSGTYSVTASASDNVGVTKVEFYLDGALKSTDTTSPYAWSWDTTTATNASHSLQSKAYDAAGNVGSSATVSVTVNNAVADTTPPTTSITAPSAGSTVSGTISVTASASDNVGVSKVEFYLDGALKSTDTTSPYAWSWDTTTATNASHSLQSKAYDAANNVGTSTAVSVTVSNGGVVDQTAVYSSTLKAPQCSVVGKSCTTGASLILGRATKGPEPNYSNTINASCADGTSGTYHVDESLDALKVKTSDGTALARGKTVTIEATVYAYSSYSSDKLDLYYAPNASSPSWTFIGTVSPTKAGSQVLTKTYTIPSGGTTSQAIRGQFRYSGSAGTCTSGSYNDRDDLVFAVQ